MIYLLIILDVIINNFTKYTSYFFLIYLYKKEYRYYLLTGLILDLLIFNTFLLNTLILTVMYICNKVFKELNKNNFYNFLFVTVFNYLLYIILTNLITINNVPNILINIGMNLLINILFYILSFRLVKNSSNF